jgi:hypothetical protein
MEEMQCNLMFRGPAGLGIDNLTWVATVFSKNWERLPTTDMPRKVMAAILTQREGTLLLSDGHFSADGTLIKTCALMKSFQPKTEGKRPDNEGPDDPPTPSITADNRPTQSDTDTEPGTEPMPAPITTTATPRPTSTARSVRMLPTFRLRIPRHGFTRNRPAPVRRGVSWAKR